MKPIIRSVLFALLTFFIVQSSVAQAPRETVSQSIEWMAMTSNIKVHKHLNFVIEGQFRFVSNFEPMQFQVRTGPDVIVNKHWSFMPLAYVYVWNPQYGQQPNKYVNNEHRIYEQVVYKHSIGRLHFSHRARLEQRFLQVHEDVNGEIVNEGYDLYTNRFRYRFAANIPINNSKMDPKTFYASVYDEFFFSWGDPVTFHKIDQNRIFAGIGYQVTKDFSFQGGFLYQMLVKANGAKQENNSGIQVQINYNIDLTKKVD
jgi:hypothetical protein